MPKKPITKVADKLTKVGECVNIYFYDNAYMVEVTGRDYSDDWANVKLVAKSLDEVTSILLEVESLPRE
jgi:isopentenyl diphosphate isomerase/L-lactate dehydrogenase-like FMN-dependent dehydrogenase